VVGADARAVVAVEVLVEQDQVPPVPIGLKLLGCAVHGAPAMLVPEEGLREAPGDLPRNLEQRHPNTGARLAFHGELISIEQIQT
jgi:hypothetical protein